MNDYKTKYLKYKAKYLALEQNMKGGSIQIDKYINNEPDDYQRKYLKYKTKYLMLKNKH